MSDSAPAQPALESLPGASVASARAATGEAADALSFEALLRRHQAMVFSIARHYVFDEARAEDIAQDVFLQLHAELARLQSEAHVVAWLRRVTAHRSIDALRSPAMARATTLDAMGDPVAPVAEQDFLLADHLRRLVASLPDQQRMAVILRYQEDLSPGEIAETLEMPVATVKSHLRRALDGLRQKASRLASPASRLAGGDGKDHHV